MAARIAINGFGQTGRMALRAAMRAAGREVEVLAVNDMAEPAVLAGLFARDSVQGRFPGEVTVDGQTVWVGGHPVRFLAEPDVTALPWKDLDVEVVIEAADRFTSRDEAAGHLAAGARRVVVSAPAKGADATFVIGVNEATFDPARHFVVSNASCTTNCLAVLAKVLDDAFEIEEGLMTTVHSYTGDQRLVDAAHHDPRRSRAAAVNIVPTSTGAAQTTGVVLSPVEGHLDGLALRVPVPDGSLTDLVALVRQQPTAESVNAAYQQAAHSVDLRRGRPRRSGRILEYASEPLVSTDVIGSTASCIFDPGLTMVTGRLVKVLGSYDNEAGYAARLIDLAALIGAA
jgi:glyceraldehyde 3-phosphate dehydrogenase